MASAETCNGLTAADVRALSGAKILSAGGTNESSPYRRAESGGRVNFCLSPILAPSHFSGRRDMRPVPWRKPGPN